VQSHWISVRRGVPRWQLRPDHHGEIAGDQAGQGGHLDKAVLRPVQSKSVSGYPLATKLAPDAVNWPSRNPAVSWAVKPEDSSNFQCPTRSAGAEELPIHNMHKKEIRPIARPSTPIVKTGLEIKLQETLIRCI
jgi:hypothetical protein